MNVMKKLDVLRDGLTHICNNMMGNHLEYCLTENRCAECVLSLAQAKLLDMKEKFQQDEDARLRQVWKESLEKNLKEEEGLV